MQGLGAPAKLRLYNHNTSISGHSNQPNVSGHPNQPQHQCFRPSQLVNTNVSGHPRQPQHQCFTPSQPATTPMFSAIVPSHNTNVSRHPNQPQHQHFRPSQPATTPTFQAIPTSHNTNVSGHPDQPQHQCFRLSSPATTPMFQAIPASHNTNVLAYSGHPNQPHLISCSRHSSLSRASFFTVRSSSIKSIRREVSSPLVCSRSLDRCCNRDCRSDTSPSCAWVRREICPKEHQQDLVILSHPSRHHEGSH